MAINAKLEMRQTQSLVMTPQLQQAIKLLQLSNIELSTFVEGELERNPLLEWAESDVPVSPLAEDREAEGADAKGDGAAEVARGRRAGSISNPAATALVPRISTPIPRTRFRTPRTSSLAP